MDATQQKGSPKQLRGRSLGAKLSEAEYAVARRLATEKSAARRGQALSEWCRQVLLDAAAGPAQAPEAEVILSETLAFRKIVINLLYGEKAGDPLSEERMQERIEATGRSGAYPDRTSICKNNASFRTRHDANSEVATRPQPALS